MATTMRVCEIARMAKGDVEPGISAELEALLLRVKPDELSPRQYCLQSKVSTSFFTDLRKGTDPSIDRVERLANRAGLTLTELIEGKEKIAPGRLSVPVALPNEERLQTMMSALLQTVGVPDPEGGLANELALLLPNALEQAGAVLAPQGSGTSRKRGEPAQPSATANPD